MEYFQYESSTINNLNNSRQNKRKKVQEICVNIQQPVKHRNQANARERDRTHSTSCECPGGDVTDIPDPLCVKQQNRSTNVNSAFTALRTLIPTEPKDRKLSKIETLRLATSYISHLATQLLAGPIDQPCLTTQFFESNDDFTPNSRHRVCTFCISHKKTKSGAINNFSCQNDGKMFFTNQNNTNLTSISYY